MYLKSRSRCFSESSGDRGLVTMTTKVSQEDRKRRVFNFMEYLNKNKIKTGFAKKITYEFDRFGGAPSCCEKR